MKPLKILFADDDLKYSMLLKRFLEKEGYEVTYAGNGLIALDQFPLVKPDLACLTSICPGSMALKWQTIRERTSMSSSFFFRPQRQG